MKLKIKKIFALCDMAAKLEKASWNGYNQGGWLISQDLLKNWIAEGVASDVNDLTFQG